MGYPPSPLIAPLAGDDEALDELLGPARHDLEGQSVHVVVLLGPSGAPAVAGALDGGGMRQRGADVRLVEDGDATGLEHTFEANVGGKLAQIGSRLVESTTRKLAADFFGKFTEIVEARGG